MDQRTIATFALVLFAGLAGCATQRAFAPLASGTSVTLSVAMDPKAGGVVVIHNTAIDDGMSAGAGSGAVVGGLYGLSCGPFAVLCVPLGMVAGLVTGIATGAAVGVTGALSKEDAARVRDRLRRVEQAHPPLAELQRQLVERARRYWRLEADAAATTVAVELQEPQLFTMRDDSVRCVVAVLVTVTPGAGNAADRVRQKRYEYVGPFSRLAVWLDEDSDVIETSLVAASQQLAAQIVADLAVK